MLFNILFSLILSFSSFPHGNAAEEKSNTLNVLMPDAVAHHVDDYLCTAVKLDENQPIYITGFNPAATAKDAHHILLYGCTEPGSDKAIWNCGEMAMSSQNPSENYEKRPTCASGSTIIYAWALDAPKTELPKDVAFKVGRSTPVNYLVLQVHYANLEKFKAGQTDRSGLILTLSPTPAPKRAGILLLATNGRIKANAEEIFQVACPITEDIVLHPFAYRVHAHKLGLVNSAYRVRGNDDQQEWTEIGRRSPQLPQMFYPVEKNITIVKNDYVAAACTMFNSQSHTVRIGSTGDDEMCNFYMMYWVQGDQLLNNNLCVSAGPPNYYFRHTQYLNTEKIPNDAFRVPPGQLGHSHHG